MEVRHLFIICRIVALFESSSKYVVCRVVQGRGRRTQPHTVGIDAQTSKPRPVMGDSKRVHYGRYSPRFYAQPCRIEPVQQMAKTIPARYTP